MKKVILLITITFFLTGCVNIKNSTYEQIINYALNNENVNLKNKSENGYSYYLPTGLNLVENNKSNIIFQNEKYRYYMYVDLISYYNKIKETYTKNNVSYVSMAILKNEKFGYLEINLRKDKKYLVEIMYNYAKIEVIVREIDAKVVVSNALSILASIDFNNDVLKTLLDEEVSQFSEFEIDIFDTVTSADSQYLGTVEEKEEDEEEVHDSDYIN